MNGKGDKQRPKFITEDEYEDNWNRTFGTPEETSEPQIVEDTIVPGTVEEIWNGRQNKTHSRE